MIRVLALYSQCKQQLSISAEPVIDCTAARRLASVLKMFLGFEATLILAIAIYEAVVDDSELLINPHKTKLDKITQSLSPALAQKVLLYAEQRLLHQWRPICG